MGNHADGSRKRPPRNIELSVGFSGSMSGDLNIDLIHTKASKLPPSNDPDQGGIALKLAMKLLNRSHLIQDVWEGILPILTALAPAAHHGEKRLQPQRAAA